MVMADRNGETIRNITRSRGPSPNSNGHYSDDSSASDDSDQDNGMRVGDEFQAFIPEFNSGSTTKPDSRMEAMLVWAPHPKVPDMKVNKYITVAKEKYGYNTEQALGMLFWHKHNIDKALADLPNFTPFPDEWTVEDKVLFEQAFSFHGKSFHRIRQMLPDKSICSLVKYYYSWKKTRSRTSLMDKQARRLAGKGDDSDDMEVGSGDSDSDFESIKDAMKDTEGKNTCSNCGAGVHQLNSTSKGGLCTACMQYWKRTGSMRSTSGAKKFELNPHTSRYNPIKKKTKPPRGMYLNSDELMMMATGPPGQGEALIKNLEAELVALKRQVQCNKQILSQQKHKTVNGIDDLKASDNNERIIPRWTNEELLLAVQGIRKYGKDFQAISDVIGNKTEMHVRSFFVNYRRRYNLDEVVSEFESEHPEAKHDTDDDVMEVDPKDVPQENGKSVERSTETAPPSNSAPPPLLKQLPGSPQHSPSQQPRIVPPATRPILQQPPPLIRPSVVPLHPKSPHIPSTPPQLSTRE